MANIDPVKIKYKDGIEYTLEFNRASVEHCEKAGFNADLLDTMPMTQIPLLFHYAFEMHHPTLKKKRTDEILFDDLKGMSEELALRLVELYNLAMSTLMKTDEAGDEESKNAKAEVIL